MKLSEWYRSQPGQVWLMAAVIVMLLVMIASRWSWISHTAGEAFRERFSPPIEQTAPQSGANEKKETQH